MVAETFNLESATVNLNETFNAYASTNEAGKYPSDYLKGLASQDTNPVDHIITDALRNQLFAESGAGFGSDLYAMNIQRGRDHGLPSYNEFRKQCGESELTSFADLDEIAFNSDVRTALEEIYDRN